MEVFVQQLINGLTLGSIYGLIAIGYTMVYGILNMVNFAHSGVFMISSFIALTALLFLTNFVQVTQGQRNKSIPPMFNQVVTLIEGRGYDVAISYEQIMIWVMTA